MTYSPYASTPGVLWHTALERQSASFIEPDNNSAAKHKVLAKTVLLPQATILVQMT